MCGVLPRGKTREREEDFGNYKDLDEKITYIVEKP